MTYEGHQLKSSVAELKKQIIKDHRVRGLSNCVKCQSEFKEIVKSSSSSKRAGRKWNNTDNNPSVITRRTLQLDESTQQHFHRNYFDTHVKNCIGF